MKDTIAHAPARMVLIVVGWCAVALGAIGAVTPGLPTTVFVLIAFACFSKSSPRFARWLSANRWLGPPLRRHLADRGMSAPAKRAAIAAMWTSIAVSAALLVAVHPWAAATTVGMGVVGTLSILFGVRTIPVKVDDSRTWQQVTS